MKNFFVFFWLFVIITATSWYFFMPGMFYLHDFLHTARMAEVANGLRDGHFPVRWSENFGYGYGEPVFEFYAPLPFYVGGLLLLVGVPALMATKFLFILCNIGTSIGSYYLGKSFYGRIGGLVAAAAISLAPYRAVNLYVRGALSESWGVMAIIWIIYFLWQTVRGRHLGWLGLTVSLVVLFLSHNLLTMMFMPFAVLLTLVFFLYSYFQYGKEYLLNRGLHAGAAYVLATGIASFYVIPAFMEKSFTQVQNIVVGGYFDYAIHFVYLRQFFIPNWGYGGSTFGPEDGISFFLGYGQIVTATVSLLTLLVSGYFLIKKTKKTLSLTKWWLVASLFLLLGMSLLLTTQKTAFIWSALSTLQFIQFPWRFLSISLVFLGMVAPFFLMPQKSFLKRWLLGLIGMLVCFANVVYFKPLDPLSDPFQYYSVDPATIKGSLSTTLPDYLPAAVPSETISGRPAPQAIADCQSTCALQVVTDKVQKKVLRVSAQDPTTLTFSINYFPGWISKINGLVTQPNVENGLITVTVPAGQSEIIEEFVDTPLRSMADTISLLAVLVFGITYAYQVRKKHAN